MELYRLLQQQGLGSRKECKQLIEWGWVEFNGSRQTHPSTDIVLQPGDELRINGQIYPVLIFPLYLLMHKPAGYEVSHQPMHHPSVFSLLPPRFLLLGLSAVGRLDEDTTGLLLFSTDGQFVHALTSPKKHVSKRYRVQLKHTVNDALISQLLNGVQLKDEKQPVTALAAEQVGDNLLALTIAEGRYHQVKRMVAAAGNRVVHLHREAIGTLGLGSLEMGAWRHLTDEERQLLGG